MNPGEQPQSRPSTVALIVGALVAVGLVALVVFVLSNGRSGDGGDKATFDDPVIPQSERAVLPSFSAKLVTGPEFTKTVMQFPAVVHIFSSQCASCLTEAPNIARLESKHKDLHYYLVAVRDTPNEARIFVNAHDWIADAAIINDSRGLLARRLGMPNPPATIFVDSDGKVAARVPGPSIPAELTAAAEAIE